MKTHRGSRL